MLSLSLSPDVEQVDLLCSHWFVRTDWVKLLFREKWETPETGEVSEPIKLNICYLPMQQ